MPPLDPDTVISFSVQATCSVCKGQGKVSSGVHRWGSQLRCALCGGTGRIRTQLPLEDLITLLKRKLKQP